MTTPETDSHDPLERVVQLRAEIESHRDRLQGLTAELADKDPKAVAQTLTLELCDTVMSLFADFAGATADTMEYERDYITEELEPAVFGDTDDEPDGPEESQLTPEDAAEYSVILGAYRTMLAAQHEAATNDELKAEIATWIERVDTRMARTLEITMEPDLDDVPDDEPVIEQSNGQASD